MAGAFSLQTGGIMRHEKMTRMYDGPLDPLGPIPCYRLFRAADGEYLFVACGNVTFWNKLALAIERPELVSDARFEGAPWGVPSAHRQALKDLLQGIFATRPREEWIRILRENDIPCAPVLSRMEFIDHPQVDALAMRRAIDDPTLGATIQPGIAVGLELTPGEIAGPAPAVKDDPEVERWLAEPPARAPSDAPREGKFARGPLDGLLILDFCSYIAGSYGPMILGQMGADVIKIESLEGDAFRHFGFGFLGWNQGKRALSLDLGSPEGREMIHGLVRRADIVVENLRPGRMRRFGLDYQSLAAINPRLIYMSVNGFGNRGPEHNQPGFDPLLQARSGLMAAEGGHHHPPLYLTCAICDYGAAMLSAFGCVLALRAREQLGRGQLCETSLLQSAMAFQQGEFIFFDGRPDLENGRPEARGRSALCRAYQCRDGAWMFVHAAAPAQWDAMSRVCKLAAGATLCGGRPRARGWRTRAGNRRGLRERRPRAGDGGAWRGRQYLRSAHIARLISSTIPRSRPTICWPNCAIRNGEPSCRPAPWRSSPRRLVRSSTPRRFWASTPTRFSRAISAMAANGSKISAAVGS